MLRTLFLILILVNCQALAVATQIKVAVATNFANPMQQLVRDFEQQSKHQVAISYGSSGKIYAQIVHGAPFHLFFSADQAKPDALQKVGLVVAGSRFTYAIGALALWSAKPNYFNDKAFDFHRNDYKLALANPKLAPYGQAALQTLVSLNAKEASEKHWVMGENIAQTFHFVQSR